MVFCNRDDFDAGVNEEDILLLKCDNTRTPPIIIITKTNNPINVFYSSIISINMIL